MTSKTAAFHLHQVSVGNNNLNTMTH